MSNYFETGTRPDESDEIFNATEANSNGSHNVARFMLDIEVDSFDTLSGRDQQPHTD